MTCILTWSGKVKTWTWDMMTCMSSIWVHDEKCLPWHWYPGLSLSRPDDYIRHQSSSPRRYLLCHGQHRWVCPNSPLITFGFEDLPRRAFLYIIWRHIWRFRVSSRAEYWFLYNVIQVHTESESHIFYYMLFLLFNILCHLKKIMLNFNAACREIICGFGLVVWCGSVYNSPKAGTD